MSLIHAYDEADNAFGSTTEKLVKVAMGAHNGLKSSKTEEKRRLINLVFSTVKLRGNNLEFTMRAPFYHFIKIDEWINGGEKGIRTLEKRLTSTPLAGERLRPLGHLSFKILE